MSSIAYKLGYTLVKTAQQKSAGHRPGPVIEGAPGALVGGAVGFRAGDHLSNAILTPRAEMRLRAHFSDALKKDFLARLNTLSQVKTSPGQKLWKHLHSTISNLTPNDVWGHRRAKDTVTRILASKAIAPKGDNVWAQSLHFPKSYKEVLAHINRYPSVRKWTNIANKTRTLPGLLLGLVGAGLGGYASHKLYDSVA